MGIWYAFKNIIDLRTNIIYLNLYKPYYIVPYMYKTTPIPVIKSLRKLGEDMRNARKRRRIPVKIMAERASISRATLNKIEKGDIGVLMGNYATVLFCLGMNGVLSNLMDSSKDIIGLQLEEENLPQRIRRKKAK